MMQKQEFDQLLNKYKSGECTPDEIVFIENWYLTYKEPSEEILSLSDRKEDLDEVWNNMTGVLYKKQILTWPRIAAAASILIFFSIGSYYLLRNQQTHTLNKSQLVRNKMHDIAPGGNKAVLTLSSGKQIVLTGTQNGKLAEQGSAAISKTTDGQIVYNTVANSGSNTEVLYNTMTTPKGGQYWVILPDGSKALLNAASSLRYPTVFRGKERKVELKGEAYFEVVHNDKSPFRVATEGQIVEDIGTHFNINSYADESVTKTTLLEGSVKVLNGNQEVILNPGQQSQLNINSGSHNIKVIDKADVEEAVAWKNGLFEFKNASIRQVMYNAARWYDLNVIYEDKIPDIKISGRMSRNVNFSGLINLLEFEGLKFKIDGKNVTILR